MLQLNSLSYIDTVTSNPDIKVHIFILYPFRNNYQIKILTMKGRLSGSSADSHFGTNFVLKTINKEDVEGFHKIGRRQDLKSMAIFSF